MRCLIFLILFPIFANAETMCQIKNSIDDSHNAFYRAETCDNTSAVNQYSWYDAEKHYVIENAVELQARLDAREESLKKEKMENRRKFCDDLLDNFIIAVEDRALTAEQKAQYLADTEAISRALKYGMLGTAKSLLESFTPDGVIALQSEKDSMLTNINNYMATE